MSTFAKQYAESLAQVSGHVAMIADRDQIIAAAGGMKNSVGKYVSRELESKVNNRESVVSIKGERDFIPVTQDGVTKNLAVLIPRELLLGCTAGPAPRCSLEE